MRDDMTTVSQHTPVKCTDPECMGCMFCAGGLFGCSVCGALEGATPTHCPKERMTADQVDAVYAGRLNFRGGVWVEEVSESSPAWTSTPAFRAEIDRMRATRT